jgi:hypothetical protein
MSILILTKQEARDILDGDLNGAKVISNTLTDHSRWSLSYRLIFEMGGKLYETSYSRGATENQEERPFEYDKEVKCAEVEAYDKTVTDWRPVRGETA